MKRDFDDYDKNNVDWDKLRPANKLSTRILKIASPEMIIEWAKQEMITSYRLLKNGTGDVFDYYLFDSSKIEYEIKRAALRKVQPTPSVYPVICKNADDIPEQLKLIPNIQEYGGHVISCVYFLIRKDVVVYVGQSTALGLRISTHFTSIKVFDRVLYILVPQKDLDAVEQGFIKRLQPEYNVTHNSTPDQVSPLAPVEGIQQPTMPGQVSPLAG